MQGPGGSDRERGGLALELSMLWRSKVKSGKWMAQSGSLVAMLGRLAAKLGRSVTSGR